MYYAVDALIHLAHHGAALDENLDRIGPVLIAMPLEALDEVEWLLGMVGMMTDDLQSEVRREAHQRRNPNGRVREAPPADAPPGPSSGSRAVHIEGLDLGEYPPDAPPSVMTLDLMLARAFQMVALARAGGMDTAAPLDESLDAARPLGIGFVAALAEMNEDVVDVAGEFGDLLTDEIEAHHAATDPLHVGRDGPGDER